MKGAIERYAAMAREGQALRELRKLQADRLALEEKQRGLEAQAALELGKLLMGTGLEDCNATGFARRRAGAQACHRTYEIVSGQDAR